MSTLCKKVNIFIITENLTLQENSHLGPENTPVTQSLTSSKNLKHSPLFTVSQSPQFYYLMGLTEAEV